jgi:AcrR family transcriptional regulator
MAAADRRRAILAAAIPLLIERGPSVTTAAVARAAGIAEGTIFRVFPDKSTLLFEAVKSAMDSTDIADAIRAVSPSAPMREQLAEAARVLLDHFKRMMALGESLRSMSALHGARQRDVGRLIKESSAGISAALVSLFERHSTALRVPPAAATAALRGLIFASEHPLLPAAERLTVDDVVSILLSGIAKPERR